MPLLTVITATKDLLTAGREDHFRRCIDSISHLTVPHEHLIVDGASTDGTVALLGELANANQSLRFVSEPDTGIYNAFNKGVRMAKGKWIYFLGSDDYVFSPTTMDAVVDEAEKAGVEMIISPVRNSNGSCWFAGKRDFGNILLYKPYGHQGVLMTKDLLLRLGLFDESYRIVSDFKLCLEAHLQNVKHLLIPKTYAEFTIDGGLSNTDKREYEERTDVTIKAFHLEGKERDLVISRELLPLRIIARLLLHRNEAIRIGARHAALRRFANVLGLLDEHGAPKVRV